MCNRSKSADQVSEADGDRPEWFEKGVELALLAPTAVNQQKFLIRLNADSSVDFIDNTKLLGQVDLGIVRYHFEVGSGVSCKP